MNGNYKGDDTVGRLMYDFGCKEAKDMYYSELAKRVKHFKKEGGRERMCEAGLRNMRSKKQKVQD